MSELEDLYQDVILHHSRSPRNFGRVEAANRSAEGYNPICGDRCKISARIEDGRIEDLRFEGQGCAISTASASVMTDALKGHTVDEAKRALEGFHALVTGSGEEANDEGDAARRKLAVFAGVRKFPMRVKCAMLAWRTLEAALQQDAAPVSTE